jgi:beta-glucosidase
MLKKIVFFISFLILIAGIAKSESPLNKEEINNKVIELLSKMTLEEKVGQMLNVGLPVILTGSYWDGREAATFDTSRLAYYVGKYGAGCIHNTPGFVPTTEEWYKIVKQIQDYAMHNTRMGIPVIYGIDDIHGANYVRNSTMLPQQIALAATWNPNCAYKSGEITSYESRAASLVWNYNPNADVATQPLWGRIGESFGEDPYLISRMTVAYMQGSQNGGLDKNTSTAVCIKHFLGYGAGLNGKDRSNALIPENYLRQYFIPPFKAAIDSGAMSIMISSNAVNGIPCHNNKYYITDILKGELGFKGIVVTDFDDVAFLNNTHNVAIDMKEAAKMAINAGIDMVMNPYNAGIVDLIIDLVKSNEIEMSRIDDAVTRILKFKYSMNLFENPYNNPADYPKFASAEFANDNYEVACEAITLLKNDEVLPLKKNKKILVTGFTSNSINCLNGAWSRSFLGQDTKYNDPKKQTILDAIKQQVGASNVTFAEGTNYETDINTKEAVLKAKDVDYIVACLGEIPATEKPSDINELPIPIAQQQLIMELAKTGKPIIIVLVGGRPRIIKDIEPLAKGIIMAYLPGDEGGRAISSILFGDKNPSGKLPYTYPKYTGNTLTYWHKKADIRDVTWNFNGFYPQYQFGFGLSYTNFEYSDPKLSTDKLLGNDELTITIDVKNTGKRTGKEVVECYIKDIVASVSPDVMKLVRFDKIELKPGETKTVTFKINKNDLAFIGADNKWITEPGQFKVMVGGNPDKLKIADFKWLNE